MGDTLHLNTFSPSPPPCLPSYDYEPESMALTLTTFFQNFFVQFSQFERQFHCLWLAILFWKGDVAKFTEQVVAPFTDLVIFIILDQLQYKD